MCCVIYVGDHWAYFCAWYVDGDEMIALSYRE